MADGGEKLAKGVTSEEASKLVNVQAPVDGRTKLFALHDFDLDISLEGLGNMKGPGGVHNAFMLAYMARKGQLEATCGVQVSCPNDQFDYYFEIVCCMLQYSCIMSDRRAYWAVPSEFFFNCTKIHIQHWTFLNFRKNLFCGCIL